MLKIIETLTIIILKYTLNVLQCLNHKYKYFSFLLTNLVLPFSNFFNHINIELWL